MKKQKTEALQATYAVAWRGMQISWFADLDDAETFKDAMNYPENYEVIELHHG